MPRGGKNARIKKKKEKKRKRKTDTHTKKNFTRTIARSSVVNDTTARWILLSVSKTFPLESFLFFFFFYDDMKWNKDSLHSRQYNNLVYPQSLSPYLLIYPSPSTNPLGALPEDAYYTPRGIYRIYRRYLCSSSRVKVGEFGEGGFASAVINFSPRLSAQLD